MEFTEETPIEQKLYWVSYARPSEPVRVTEAGWWNDIAMDRKASRLLVTRANPRQPSQVYLADTTGKRLAWIEENRMGPDHPYGPYLDSHVEPVFGAIPGPAGDLHYRIFSPKGEPGKRHPVFVHVYAGPHGQLVKRDWSRDMPLYQHLVDRGWIVFTLDGRGTNRRGSRFESAIYRAMGGAEVEDQLAGLAWLKQRDDVDPARIAVMGWSYGGYMTLKLLEQAPGAFAAGVAVAPVTRWEMYDTFYTERYLGDPKTGPEAYRVSNALDQASGITDPLLIMHGMSDDNVVFSNSTALIAKLQKEKKPFELMVYPGATHAIAGEGPRTHVWLTIENFLDRTVRGAATTAR